MGALWKIESILHGEKLAVVGREIAESDCRVSDLGSGFDGGINSLRLRREGMKRNRRVNLQSAEFGETVIHLGVVQETIRCSYLK